MSERATKLLGRAMTGGKPYIERFIDAVARYPSRPAIVEGRRTVSYGEFGSLTRRLAFAVVEARALPRVLIHLPQTASAYAAMLAVNLAGGLYTTTNTAAPRERRRETFEAFVPDAVITDTELEPEARAHSPAARVIDVDKLGLEELDTPLTPHRLAYVMFTSGSTGKPKGVMISETALNHYVGWALDAMQLVPEDRWSQHSNVAFDLSVLDIYGALCSGAALVPILGSDLLMPAKAIKRHRLTIWNSVPSVLTSMIKIRQVTESNFASLRLLTFCGEALQKMHLESIFKARRTLVVHNTYGPTEATVSCTLLRLIADEYEQACRPTVAIGDAIPDMAIDLVGGRGVDEGEIVISGPQLAEGYWNEPELTASQFRSFIRDGSATRGYFTGDWAERAGHHVFFRGRIDNQVKIRGERVELDDISAALMRCDCGFACALLIGEELHGVFEHGGSIPPRETLSQQLLRWLPMHLIPQHFHGIAELPRNANGKVDFKAVRGWIEGSEERGLSDRERPSQPQED